LDGLFSLLDMRRRIAWNVLRTLGGHSRLKMASIAVLGGSIWVGLYVFPYYGFHWVAALLPGRDVPELLISLFFFLLTVMLVFSNAVIAYTALFRSDEALFLRSSPCPPGSVFLYKIGESLIFSSWAFFMLGVPVMLAYGMHKAAPWYYYPAIMVFFLGFVMIPASVGALVALIVSTFVRPWLRRALVRAAIALAVIALVLGPTYARRNIENADFFVATTMLQRVNFCHSVYWPSAWVSRGLVICSGASGPGALTDALYYLGLLASNGLFLGLVACWCAGAVYDRAWNAVHSGSSRPRSRRFELRPAVRGPSSQMFRLVVKDLKTFTRDPVQWTQCAVLFGLLGLYILNLRNLRYPSVEPHWRTLTTFLNLGSICLVLATLTTRFVFPMFSLEGSRFWILGLFPMDRRQVLRSKLVFSVAASLVVTETLMIASDVMLAEPGWLVALHVATVGMISIALSGMAVGLSALYPSPGETSPAKIVSGFGGTLNLILSLLFVSIVVTAEAIPVYMWYTGALQGPRMVLALSGAIVLVVALSAAAFCVPMWLGSRALARMEF